MNNLAIADLPRIARPREKLLKYGPDALSDSELLAVILRTGRKGENVIALAARLMRRMDRGCLSRASLADFVRISGIGQVKACELLAAIELGKRIFEGKKAAIGEILSPQDVFDSLQDVRESKKEHFVVFFLDSRNQQIKREIVSVGTVNASLVHPREVFEPAVRHLAVQVILAHNHPSGGLEPSEEDIDVHKRLTEAGRILGIEVLDHIIVTKTGFVSFKEKKF